MARLLLDFFRDRLALIIGYVLSSSLIILFYKLLAPGGGEFLYPALLSLFLLLVILLIQWFRFYPFCLQLKRGQLDPKKAMFTREQMRLYKALSDMQHRHREELLNLETRDKQFRRFLAQWVHHMKTPVSVIDLILQKAEEDPGHWEAQARDIRQENRRLLDGLSQVLSMVRLEEMAYDFSPGSSDLLEDVRQVINQRKSQFIYHRLFPVMKCSEESVTVLTDCKWNRILLDQLVSNAIKYSCPGEDGKTVTLSMERDHETVLLSITDEGIGIPDDDLKRVFQPFFTGENGRREPGSSGIGLYLCKQIAERLGHGLSITSQVNKGTTASVRYKCPAV